MFIYILLSFIYKDQHSSMVNYGQYSICAALLQRSQPLEIQYVQVDQ